MPDSMEVPSRETSESVVHNATPTAEGTSLSVIGSRSDGNLDQSPPLTAGLNVNHVVHQRRRVNPESLALRLGPDLVRDLDALITPGNTEMPSFAVRKELQERYNIDRRHIYDYFHSRGLRVVKEDKHGNPMAVKDVPAPLPNLRPLRQGPIKTSRSHPIATERNLFKPRGVTKAKPGRPRKIPAADPVLITCATDESTGTNNAAVSERSSSPVPTPVYVSVNPLLPLHSPVAEEDENCAFNSVVNPLGESFSVRRAIGDVAYAYRHKLVFERMQELTGHPVSLVLTEDRLLSWNETSPCSASAKGLLVPHAQPLTRDERQVIYKTLSDSLGPAHGIQECQGTYRKHMEARTKLYFEGLLAVPYHHSQQPAKTCTLLDRKPPSGTNEFRHWLSETRFLKRDGMNGSPRLQPGCRNANVAKQEDIEGAADKQSRLNYKPQTLDELFPAAGDELSSSDTITDSPVFHARQVTHITARAQVNETRPSGHSQFHGLSAFSGPRNVKTRVSGAEVDGRPQCLEQAAHLGPLFGPTDTQPKSHSLSHNTRIRVPSYSPRKHPRRDLDRVWTRPVTPRDTRRRTPSATGDI